MLTDDGSHFSSTELLIATQSPRVDAVISTSRRLLMVSVILIVVVAVAAVAFPWKLIPDLSLEQLAQLATAIATLLIMVSAFLVYRQVREAANTVRAQVFDATAGRILELSRLFVEHPELRPYFNDGLDSKDAEEPLRSQVLAVAEMHLDFFDTELLRARTFPAALRGLPSFKPWIRGLFRSSPAMCHRLDQDASLGIERWYDDVHDLYTEDQGKDALRQQRAQAASRN